MNVWAVIGLALTAAIGVWRFLKRLRTQKRKQAEEAKKMLEEGLEEGDTSKITAAFNRINRI